VYSPDLGLAIKHKLPSDTTVFSAEVWAIYQALILIDSSSSLSAAIFSDSRSVLDALSSLSLKSGSNYLIPLIRDKFHSMTTSSISIRLAWIPSHRDIPGNESADSLAKQAASNGRKPKFKIPFTDFLPRASQHLKTKFSAFLKNDFLSKPFILSSFSNLPFPNHGSFTFRFLEIRLSHFADSDQITTLIIAYTEKILWPLPPARVGTLAKMPITSYSDALSPEINPGIYCYTCIIITPMITRIFFPPSRIRPPSFVVC